MMNMRVLAGLSLGMMMAMTAMAGGNEHNSHPPEHGGPPPIVVNNHPDVDVHTGNVTTEVENNVKNVVDVTITGPTANGGAGGNGGQGGQGGKGGDGGEAHANATGGSVTGSGNSTNDVKATGGSVAGSGNSSVTIVDSSKQVNISPHAALVPNAPIPTVFDHSNGANATGAKFEILVSRLCAMQVTRDLKRIRTEGKSDETDIVFTPFARDAYAGAGNSDALVIETGTTSDPQRYRCIGTLLVQGKPKKAEYVDLASLQYDALHFASEKVGGAPILGLLFDACDIAVNNGVLSFGRGIGASAGASNVWDSALGTVIGGLSGNKGRSLNFSQMGATYVVIAPTVDTGPGTFTLGDISRSGQVAQATVQQNQGK